MCVGGWGGGGGGGGGVGDTPQFSYFFKQSFKGDIQLKMPCLDYFEGYTGKLFQQISLYSFTFSFVLFGRGALIQVKMFTLYPLFYPLRKGSYLRLFMVI